MKIYAIRHGQTEFNINGLLNGEKLEDVMSRVKTILEIIKKDNGDGEALIVTHGGVIRMLRFIESGQLMDDVSNASLHMFKL